MAKYAFLFIDDGVEYQGNPTPEQQKVYQDIFKWFETNGEKIAEGGAELQPTRTATTIRKRTGKVSVVDGPFIEAKESVGGFTVFELPDKAAAVELAKNQSAADSVQHGNDATALRPVKIGEGTTGHEKLEFTKPGWTTMRPGIVVDARKPGERNPYYKKYTARTMRPVVNFDTCIKCTMCWLDCPDECFEVTPEGHYEVVYSACIGCGICAQVCPVKDCIVMVDELKFTDNRDRWQDWKKDRSAYNNWFEQMAGVPADPKKAAGAGASMGGSPAATGGDE